MGAPAPAIESLVQQLAKTASEPKRHEILARSPALQSREGVERLHAEVLRLSYVDLDQAERLAECSRSQAAVAPVRSKRCSMASTAKHW